jgi:trehalose 6-phosphate phosphatase
MTRAKLPPPPPARLGWAYFLDVDGTLVEFAPRPDTIHVDADLLGLLKRLDRDGHGGLALVSGRALADLSCRLDGLKVPMAGQHGLERLDASGNIHLDATALPHLAIRTMLLDELEAHPGLLLEDKGMTLALHYRQTPALGAYVHRLMAGLARRLGTDYALQKGKFVVELKPAAADKGKAIAAYLAEPPFAGRHPVFIGDDVTDEHGFEAINRLGGLSIKVGPGNTAARHRLADVAAVRAWLAAALQE